MIYEYECPIHGHRDIVKPMAASKRDEKCPICGVRMKRLVSMPAVHGTRDGFGINNAFTDENTGQVIDTWPKWEKAGYCSALEHTRKSHVREGIKQKMKRIKDKEKLHMAVM